MKRLMCLQRGQRGGQTPGLWDFYGERGSSRDVCGSRGAPQVPGGSSCLLLVLLHEPALGKKSLCVDGLCGPGVCQKIDLSKALAVQGPKPQLILLKALSTATKPAAVGSR